MNPADTRHLVADLLKRSGHPDIADVDVGATAVRVTMADGSANYVKVAHIQPAGHRRPERPTWPGHVTAEPKAVR